MKSFIIGFLILVTGFVTSTLIYLILFPKPVEDFIIAKTIPQYPNLITFSLDDLTYSQSKNQSLTRITTQHQLQSGGPSVFSNISGVWRVETHIPFGPQPYASISFNTTDSPETVVKFYVDRLSQKGWDIGNNIEKELQIKFPTKGLFYEVFTKDIGDRKFELSIRSSLLKATTYTDIFVNKKNL
ncbi:hypothetical protein HYT18_01875 [Candidatus Microgenomates bacterium]|nr:hypothetical protein [Candidatus Microgenomates bacterium]